jgi:hypothetical protein
MPKITVHGGPSYEGHVDVTPSDVTEPRVGARPGRRAARPGPHPPPPAPHPHPEGVTVAEQIINRDAGPPRHCWSGRPPGPRPRSPCSRPPPPAAPRSTSSPTPPPQPAVAIRGAGDLLRLRDDAGTDILKITQSGAFVGASGVAPAVITPHMASPNSATAWPAANRAMFARFTVTVPGAYRYLLWRCDASAGNVQVGVVQLSGTDHTTYTRIAHTGVIACPALGHIRSDLAAFTLGIGDYAAFVWADNTTMQTRHGSNAGVQSMRVSAIASSLSGGVPASGTLAWDAAYVTVAVEGDV